MKPKPKWDEMTDAQKAQAHCEEAAYFARKATKAHKTGDTEKAQDEADTVADCLRYAAQWGANAAQRARVAAILPPDLRAVCSLA